MSPVQTPAHASRYDPPADRGSDAKTIVAPGEVYMQILVDEVRRDLSSVSHASIEYNLPIILEQYALRIGYHGAGSAHQKMMHIVHKNSMNIARRICGKEQLSLDTTPAMSTDPLAACRVKLRSTQDYTWLIHTLKCMISMNGIATNVLDSHRDCLLDTLWDNTPSTYRHINQQRTPNLYITTFQLPWNLPKFIEEQKHADVDVPGIVGQLITLTGNCEDAYATTCLEYMTRLWPSMGPELVAFFERLLRDPNREHIRKSQAILFTAIASEN